MNPNIHYNFSQQVAMVTGGTREIGRAITSEFLKAEATVVAIYNSNDQAAQAFREELGNPSTLILKKCDVGSFDQCQKLMSELDAAQIAPTILINNSGIRRDNLLLLMKPEEWAQVLQTNLGGTFNMTKLVAERMLRKRYGRIVNIGSIAGALGLPGQANYSASKAGQEAFSKSVGKELAKKNITINTIAPGFVETELISDLPEAQVEEYKKQVPMKRFAKAREIAMAALFLASEEAGYITGSTLEIAGGLN